MATTQHLLTSKELLEATYQERRRRGWAAVAPELEPYLDTQRWPSGVPLSEDFRPHVARGTRMPPWMPQRGVAVWMLFLGVCAYPLCCRWLEWSKRGSHGPCMACYGHMYHNSAC